MGYETHVLGFEDIFEPVPRQILRQNFG